MGPDMESIVVTVITFTAAAVIICSMGLYVGVLLGRYVLCGVRRVAAVIGTVLP